MVLDLHAILPAMMFKSLASSSWAVGTVGLPFSCVRLLVDAFTT